MTEFDAEIGGELEKGVWEMVEREMRSDRNRVFKSYTEQRHKE